MIKEILSSLKDNARERIKNPLIGAFIVSWCVYNWEVILRVYSIRENPEAVINPLKTLFRELDRFYAPVLFSLLYVLISPWLTACIQKLRSASLMISKKDKLVFELNLLKEKEKIITQEANNDGVKTKISKDMELSFKEREFAIDQKIKQSGLDAKLKEVEEEKQKNKEEREELDNVNQTLKERLSKLEENEKEYAKRDEILRGEEDKREQKTLIENLRKKSEKGQRTGLLGHLSTDNSAKGSTQKGLGLTFIETGTQK